MLRNLLTRQAETIAPDFPAEPLAALAQANKIIAGGVDLVVASSYGGFIALNLDNNPLKLLINPCLRPSKELGKVEEAVPDDIIALFESMESKQYAMFGDRSRTHALFTDDDELFSYKDEYLQHFSNVYTAKGGHRLSAETMTDTMIPLVKQICRIK
jgi:predicted esterase YcpF (UPF0227 family)